MFKVGGVKSKRFYRTMCKRILHMTPTPHVVAADADPVVAVEPAALELVALADADVGAVDVSAQLIDLLAHEDDYGA